MKIEISMEADHLTVTGQEDLVANFARELEADPAFELRRPLQRERAMDPIVLASIVGTLGTVLAPLLTGLLRLARESPTKTIQIELENGRKLKVPVDLPPEELERLIERLQQPAEKPIKILLP
jgi:hypothetical protein